MMVQFLLTSTIIESIRVVYLHIALHDGRCPYDMFEILFSMAGQNHVMRSVVVWSS